MKATVALQLLIQRLHARNIFVFKRTFVALPHGSFCMIRRCNRRNTIIIDIVVFDTLDRIIVDLHTS